MRVNPSRESRIVRRIEDLERTIFACVCSWGLQRAFRQISGLVSVLCYARGHADNPTHEQVRSMSTDHAEAVRIVFNPRRVLYSQLLGHLLCNCDSGKTSRRGSPIAVRYRSLVLHHNERQRAEAESAMAEFEASRSLPESEIILSEPVGVSVLLMTSTGAVA